MRNYVVIAVIVVMAVLLSGNAMAESLKGKFGVNGRLGFIIPADSDKNDPAGRLLVNTDAGITGGGGFIYGLDDNLAVEMDVIHSSFDTNSAEWGTAEINTLSFTVQYRFPAQNRIIPYVGGGVDVLISDLPSHSIDTVLGLHLAAGADYFLTSQFALNAELKGVEAFDADVIDSNGGAKVGNFNPSSLTGTLGVRFFFN